MATFIPDWAAYARIQHQLDTRTTLNDRVWGLEAAAEALLQSPIGHDDVVRAKQTASRRERNRALLRRARICDMTVAAPSPDATIDARRVLRAAPLRLADDEWQLLLSVADGEAYGDLARAQGCTAGALRVRVVRLRRSLLAAA